MATNYIIEFSAKTDGLTAANKEFEKLSQSEKKVIDQFNKMEQSANKFGKSVNSVGKEAAGINPHFNSSGNSIKKAFDPGSVRGFNTAIQNTGKEANKTFTGINKQANTVNETFSKIGVTIAGVFAVEKIISFGEEILATVSKIDKIKATLGDPTIYNMLDDIEYETGINIEKLTQAYLDLQNSGIAPTREEIIKLSDVAVSRGSSIEQLTGAIEQATLGSTKALKQFGVEAKDEGDKLKVTFHGQTQEIYKTNEAIARYLIGLGDTQGISGKTAAVADTLGVKISQLGERFEDIRYSIGTKSSGGLVNGIEFLNDGLDELNKSINDETSVFDPLREAIYNISTPIMVLYEAIKNLSSEFGISINTGSTFEGVIRGLAVALRVVMTPMFVFTRTIKLQGDAFVYLIEKAKELSNILFNTNFEISGKVSAGKLKQDLEDIAASFDPLKLLFTSSGDFQAAIDKAIAANKKAYETYLSSLSNAKGKADKEASMKSIAAIANDNELQLRILQLQLSRFENERKKAIQNIADLQKSITDEQKKGVIGQSEQNVLTSEYLFNQQQIANNLKFELRIKEQLLEIEKKKIDAMNASPEVKETLKSELIAAYNEEKAKLEQDSATSPIEFKAKVVGLAPTGNIPQNKPKGEKFDPTLLLNETLKMASMTSDALSNLSDVFYNLEKKKVDAQINNLETFKEKLLANAGDSAEKRKQIEESIATREKEIREDGQKNILKYYKLQRAAALAEAQLKVPLIALDTFSSVLKSATILGLAAPIVAAAAAATAATAAELNVIKIASSPLQIQGFAKGTLNVQGGIKGKDSVPALLMPGEAVISTSTNKQYSPTMNAIHHQLVPSRDLNQFVLNYQKGLSFDNTPLVLDTKQVVDELKALNSKGTPHLYEGFDLKGFHRIMHGNNNIVRED